MLGKIWQKLAGTKGKSGSPGIIKTGQDGEGATRSLSDEDYEFLFGQLLEGVAHGWQAARIQRFFEQLGEQGHHHLWVDWLQRVFTPKVLATPNPDPNLAQQLTLLANHTQYLPKLVEIGAMSYAIAQQLQLKATSAPIWEYDGPDAVSPSGGEQPLQQELLTVDELLVRLEQDEALAQQLSQELELTSTDPQLLVQTLIERLQSGNRVPPGPETEESRDGQL